MDTVDAVDAVVIGAGVVGLAVARALSQRGLETVVLERANAIGTGTSSRNSEVIHAGIYYATDSLKARLRVRGRAQLYDCLESHGVAHRRCGKLQVATSPAQHTRLAQIQAQAARNGVNDLRLLDADEMRAIEPELNALAALHSPSTGIVDSHGLMLALLGDLEANGGALALLSPVEGLVCGDATHVVTVGGAATSELQARFVINAAGLWAPDLAGRFAGLAPADVPRARYARGQFIVSEAPALLHPGKVQIHVDPRHRRRRAQP